MIDLNKLTGQIEIWGYDKGILPDAPPEKQLEKTIEEVQELADAIAANDIVEMADAYGDIFVTIVMGATCAGLDIRDCIEGAYNVISKRTGKMIDGKFEKDE